MGIGTSLFLIALGAVLRFAVHVTAGGFSIQTIGVILMVVGIVGLFDLIAVDDRVGRPSRPSRAGCRP